MIAGKVLICEGAPGSIDAQVLNIVRGTIQVQVVSAGSKYGMHPFIQGYVRGDRSITVLAVRDRDFDYDPAAHSSIFEDTPQQFPGRQLVWSRHELENYLLEPTILSRIWEYLRSKGVSLAGYSDEDLLSLLTQAAERIAFYQAARWTLGMLKPGNRWPLVRTTWQERSGQLPTVRDETSCWNEISQMVRTYRHNATLKTDTDIQNDFQQFCQRFTDSTFYERKDFLLWFSGKDLLSAFWEQQGILPGDAKRQKFLESCPTVLGNMRPDEWPDDFRRLSIELHNL